MRKTAFEVDGVQQKHRAGWSVCVLSCGRDVTDSIDGRYQHLRDLRVDCCAPEGRDRWSVVRDRPQGGHRPLPRAGTVGGALDMTVATGLEVVPGLLGIHHVTIPVSNVETAVDWFARVLGFDPCVTFEEEDRVTGALLEHPSGAALRLRVDPAHAVALSQYAALSFAVADRDELSRWDAHLTALGVYHTGVVPVHQGWEISLRGPGMIELHLTTAGRLDGVADDTTLTP